MMVGGRTNTSLVFPIEALVDSVGQEGPSLSIEMTSSSPPLTSPIISESILATPSLLMSKKYNNFSLFYIFCNPLLMIKT